MFLCMSLQVLSSANIAMVNNQETAECKSNVYEIIFYRVVTERTKLLYKKMAANHAEAVRRPSLLLAFRYYSILLHITSYHHLGASVYLLVSISLALCPTLVHQVVQFKYVRLR